uniref:Serine/threonine-protein kinase 1 n=1 Tax=Caenorhabditis tropicalis TaxID=1561998 RepID=A0A1I7U3A4_9PELO
MIKRKLQDLAVCCSYQVDFLHEKKHSVKEFKRKYEVLDEIGRGGFGIVYEATSRQDGQQPVAVKFVQHKHVRSWTMTCRQLIPSEVCHLETCEDIPGVIRILDWFANSKGFLIVMERPENCMDLFDMVSVHGPLNEEMAKFIFKQVIATVFEMYSKHGLLHRDIKDENLIVNMNTGEVKLVDFGATAYAEKATKKNFKVLVLTVHLNGSVINFIFLSKPRHGLLEFFSSFFSPGNYRSVMKFKFVLEM